MMYDLRVHLSSANKNEKQAQGHKYESKDPKSGLRGLHELIKPGFDLVRKGKIRKSLNDQHQTQNTE